MWNKSWSTAEHIYASITIVAAGFLLQIILGPIDWSLISYPVNLILLAFLLAVSLSLCLFRKRSHIIRQITSIKAAIVSISSAAVLTIQMGLIPQVPPLSDPADTLGLSKMLSFWPFVLIYIWMTVLTGSTALSMAYSCLRMRAAHELGPLLLHLGLFILIASGTLGNGDIKKFRITAHENETVSYAKDQKGVSHKLGMSILLKNFAIDLYPARLILMDDRTGMPYSGSKKEFIELKEGLKEGNLDGWEITIEKLLEKAERNNTGDSIEFCLYPSEGSCCAVLATAKKNGICKKGWISCGNFKIKSSELGLADGISLAMPKREPSRYCSSVDICMEDGRKISGEIEVNRPLSAGNWKLYQFGYDTSMGEWSTTCILELVKDPWAKISFSGIYMMIIGAFLLFFRKFQTSGFTKGKNIAKYTGMVILAAVFFLYETLSYMGFFSNNLMPALKSKWFGPHLAVYMAGYSCMAIALFAGLCSYARHKTWPIAADILVTYGTALITIGMLLGALWANEAWGHYWSWDPKETWAAATLGLYLIYIHLRLVTPSFEKDLTIARLYEKRYLILLAIAFSCLQICWWGINFLPSAQNGLSSHTYNLG